MLPSGVTTVQAWKEVVEALSLRNLLPIIHCLATQHFALYALCAENASRKNEFPVAISVVHKVPRVGGIPLGKGCAILRTAIKPTSRREP